MLMAFNLLPVTVAAMLSPLFGRVDLFLVATLASIFYLVIGAFGVPFVLAVLIVAYQDLKLRDRERRGAAVKRWIGLLGSSRGIALAADDAALRTVEACRARLDARVDVGIERIQKRCPELLPALASAPWRDLLPQPCASGARKSPPKACGRSRSSCGNRATVPRSRSAHPRRLEPVLADLGDKGEQGATRWERFKRWLKDKLENRKEDDESSWIEKLARQFKTSEGVAQFITYIGYAHGRRAGGLRHLVGTARCRVVGGVRRASRARIRRPNGAGACCSRTWRKRRSPSVPACCCGC